MAAFTKWHITLGATGNAPQSTVIKNGQDITDTVSYITVSSAVSKVTTVTVTYLADDVTIEAETEEQ